MALQFWNSELTIVTLNWCDRQYKTNYLWRGFAMPQQNQKESCGASRRNSLFGFVSVTKKVGNLNLCGTVKAQISDFFFAITDQFC
jgi:hypothetical protein